MKINNSMASNKLVQPLRNTASLTTCGAGREYPRLRHLRVVRMLRMRTRTDWARRFRGKHIGKLSGHTRVSDW